MAPFRTTIRETILKTLPATVPVNGDTIPVAVAWARKVPRDITKPTWVVQFAGEHDHTTSLNAHEERIDSPTQATDEPHVVPGTELLTAVDEWDIDAVQAVKTTVATVPNVVLVQGVDYQVVDSDGDGALDSIQWLARRPDDDATALITYTYKMVEKIRSHLLNTVVIVNCLAQLLKTGEQGATQTHEPDEILEAMQESLRNWYEATLKPALEAADVAVGLTMDCRDPILVPNSTTVQAANAFDTFYHQSVSVGKVRTVRKLDSSNTLTGFPVP